MANISPILPLGNSTQSTEVQADSNSAGVQRTDQVNASPDVTTSLIDRSVAVVGFNDLSNDVFVLIFSKIRFSDFLNLSVTEKSLYVRLMQLFYEKQHQVYWSDEFVATTGFDFYLNAFVTYSYFMRMETQPNFKTKPEILERKLAERDHSTEALAFTNQIIFENWDRSPAEMIEQIILQLAKCFVHRLSIKDLYVSFEEGVEALLSKDTFKGESAELDFAKHCLSFINECQDGRLMPHRLGNLPQAKEDQMFEQYQTLSCKFQPNQMDALIVNEKDFKKYYYRIANDLEPIPVLRSDLPALPMPGEISRLVNNDQISFEFLPFQISQLPESFFTLINVTRLTLEMIGLTVLPASIGKMVNLQNLNLSYNQLETLPDEIVALSQLWDLNLLRNFFRSFPKTMGQMTALERIVLEERLRELLPERLQREADFLDLSDPIFNFDPESDAEESTSSDL